MIHANALERLASQRHIPISVLFEITYRCHLACIHCYLHEGPADRPRPPKGELSLEEIQRILREVSDAGTLYITFSGGEVFLRRDFLDIVASARRLGFCVFVFTTGTLMTPELAERLAALRPFAVEASVYSRKPEVHDAITKIAGSHCRTLAALRVLKACGVRIVIKTPLMTLNAEEYHGLVDLAEELGAEYGFDPILKPRRDGDRTPFQYALSPQQLLEFAGDPRLGPTMGETGAGLPASSRGDDEICASGRRICRISPCGEVFACSVSQTPVGDLRRQSFREIWEASPYLKRLRSLTIKDLRGVTPDDPLSGGHRCSALAEIEDGDFLGSFKRGEKIAEAFRHAPSSILPA